MNGCVPAINTDTIRTRNIKANLLKVNRVQIGKRCRPKRDHSLIKIKRELLEKIRELRRKVRHEIHELERKDRELERGITALESQIVAIQAELASGLIPNPSLESFFTSKLNQSVTVTTTTGAFTGRVTVVGTDAVELTEGNGDIVIIPYSKITSAS